MPPSASLAAFLDGHADAARVAPLLARINASELDDCLALLADSDPLVHFSLLSDMFPPSDAGCRAARSGRPPPLRALLAGAAVATAILLAATLPRAPLRMPDYTFAAAYNQTLGAVLDHGLREASAVMGLSVTKLSDNGELALQNVVRLGDAVTSMWPLTTSNRSVVRLRAEVHELYNTTLAAQKSLYLLDAKLVTTLQAGARLLNMSIRHSRTLAARPSAWFEQEARRRTARDAGWLARNLLVPLGIWDVPDHYAPWTAGEVVWRVLWDGVCACEADLATQVERLGAATTAVQRAVDRPLALFVSVRAFMVKELDYRRCGLHALEDAAISAYKAELEIWDGSPWNHLCASSWFLIRAFGCVLGSKPPAWSNSPLFAPKVELSRLASIHGRLVLTQSHLEFIARALNTVHRQICPFAGPAPETPCSSLARPGHRDVLQPHEQLAALDDAWRKLEEEIREWNEEDFSEYLATYVDLAKEPDWVDRGRPAGHGMPKTDRI